MSSSKIRLKLLEKIAQAQGQPEQISNNETTGPVSLAGTPTEVSISSYFPSAITAWGSQNTNFIQVIINLLNNGIFVLSMGQLDFNKLRVSGFNVDISKYPDRVLKNVVRFGQVVYTTLLTEAGNPFARQLTIPEKEFKIKNLQNALSTAGIPDGGINQFLTTKIGGNFKSLLFNNLNNIK